MSTTPFRALRLLVFAAAVALTALLLVAPAGARTNPSVDPVCGGPPLIASVKLAHNMYCSDGPALSVGANGITIDLNGHSINGPGGCCDLVGVLIGDASNVTVKNGTFTGFDYAVGIGNSVPDVPLFGLAVHAIVGPSGNVVRSITLPNGSEEFAGYDNGGFHDTFTQIHGGVATGGVIFQDTQGDTLSSSSFGSNGIGAAVENGSNDVFTKVTVDGEFGFLIEDSNLETVSKSTVKNALFGIYDILTGPAPSVGNSYVGNKITNAEFGIAAGKFGFGTVNIQGNTVTNALVGIELGIAALINCECPSDPGSTVTGNKVTNAVFGFADDPEFVFVAGPHSTSELEGSENAVWTGNTSSNNEAFGFLFLTPQYATISGNTAKNNGDSGFYLSDNDPSSGFNAHVFSNNQASGNGFGDATVGYGFAADFVQGGSGNVAKHNAPFNCFNVACTGGNSPSGAPVHAPGLAAKLASHGGPLDANDAVPAWAHGLIHVG